MAAANYVVPQVLVFQEFNTVVSVAGRQLPAYICGGHAYLLRHSDADEKPNGFLGYYDADTETAYSWPHRPAGAVVDPAYTRVHIDNALLEYYDHQVGELATTITKTAGRHNRIRSTNLSFATHGTYAHDDAVFLDRGVKVGDVARVRATVSDVEYDLWTYVNGFVGETVAATVDEATADDANQEAIGSATVSITKTAGADNCVTVAGSATAYNGLNEGNPTETYTVVVTQSSTNGDFRTARLRVISASGNDDVSAVTPSEHGETTDIGTRGLTLTFDVSPSGDCSDDAESASVGPLDLVAGQTWEVDVQQVFAVPTITSAGTYTGTKDMTYIVTVTKGGKSTDSDKPEVTVSTDRGYDASGPTDVTFGSAVAVGTKGVTLTFAGTTLCKGDKYYIVVTAATTGAYQTIILGHNLDENIPDGTALSLTLYIRKSIDVSQNRVEAPPLTNWEQSSTELTLASGVTAYDSSWTDGGTPVALPVTSSTAAEYGKLYVTYRAWRSDLCNQVSTISEEGDLDTLISGALTPDNPLKYAVAKALANSNGVPVKFTSVCNPSDVDSWVRPLDLIEARDDVYGLVPLTHDKDVQDLFASHVDTQSAPEQGRWRVVFFALEGVPSKTVLSAANSKNTEEVLAVIEDDPNTSGTQYTIVRVPAANAQFIAAGVRPGDTVRALYDTDGFGGETYTEFTVDAVLSEDSLRVVTGHDVAVSVAQKIEVHRTLTATEEADEIAQSAGVWANRRVRAVWPDLIGNAGETVDGYYLCAALAGLCAGVVPHQGLTRLEISGFDDVSRTVNKFNRSQLNAMAYAGVWIVTQDHQTGQIYTRHAVTTGDSEDIAQREEMVCRNVDHISMLFSDRFAAFIGISNVTPSMLAIIRVETEACIEFLKSNNFVRRLGGQLIDATITELRPHVLLKDRVVLVVNLTIPYSLNNLECHLVV